MTSLVIGIVGPMGSGKGVLSDILVEKGFMAYSLSDRVREEASARGLPHTREILQNVGDALRKENGLDVLAKRTADLIVQRENQLVVIESIRNPGEIEELRRRFPNTVIVGVVASPDKRFELIQRRKRPHDPQTREEFDRLEQRDRGVGQSLYGQQVEACLRMTHIIIENEGSLEEFRTKAREFFSRIGIGIEGARRSTEVI